MQRMVVVFGTAYVTLCIIFITALSLFSSSESLENHPSKIQGGNVWHLSSKRGARPRNLFFSSEGQGREEEQTVFESNNIDETSNISKKVAVVFNDSSSGTVENNFRLTELTDIFIGLKTTEKFHESRLTVLLETWLDRSSVREQVRYSLKTILLI